MIGEIISPLWVTQALFIISSVRFMSMLPSLLMRSFRKFSTFLPYDLLASEGIEPARLESPMTVTLWKTTVSLSLVTSVLPPVAAARSIMIDPARMVAIISLVISTGAFLPNIWAVVITISAFLMLSAIF